MDPLPLSYFTFGGLELSRSIMRIQNFLLHNVHSTIKCLQSSSVFNHDEFNNRSSD